MTLLAEASLWLQVVSFSVSVLFLRLEVNEGSVQLRGVLVLVDCRQQSHGSCREHFVEQLLRWFLMIE
ncbi:MAG: hypothetical protein UT91_C0021G0005 [Parcubacteria group bacterium GW2011_GWA2_40_23]|nr:MAG: hypothetical protein UT91_C0021G0005 [Parcubacteria group bacterium GW2011_GWA2_40_23]